MTGVGINQCADYTSLLLSDLQACDCLRLAPIPSPLPPFTFLPPPSPTHALPPRRLADHLAACASRPGGGGFSLQSAPEPLFGADGMLSRVQLPEDAELTGFQPTAVADTAAGAAPPDTASNAAAVDDPAERARRIVSLLG